MRYDKYMGIEDGINKQEKELLKNSLINEHDLNLKKVSSDFVNEYGSTLSYFSLPHTEENLNFIYSLGPKKHYDEYLTDQWSKSKSDIVVEQSDKDTIKKIDALIDLYNISLKEKNSDKMLYLLTEINKLVQLDRE
jgi:hypothetical protein